MHKSKNGTVTASLTEVKNKTGDIFHLVDEFGEVTLTSYNKPRYKIIKITTDILGEFAEVKEPKTIVKKESKQVQDVKTTQKEVVQVKEDTTKKIDNAKTEDVAEEYNPIAAALSNPQVIGKVEKNESANPELISKTINIQAWNRNSTAEKNFINKALKPLTNG